MKFPDWRTGVRWGLCGLFIWVMQIPGVGWAREDIALLFGGDKDYPPYEYVDERGIFQGFNVDITRAVCEKMGIFVGLKPMAWRQARGALEAGELDVLMGMYESPERQERVSFSIPYNMASYAVFVPRGSAIGSLDDLWGMRVLVQAEDLGHDHLRHGVGAGEIVVHESIGAVITGLMAGEGEAALLPRVQALMMMKERSIDSLVPVGPPILQRAYCFAVKKGNDRVLSLLNEGLRAIKASGRYDEIYKRWFWAYEPKRLTRAERGRYILLVGGPLLGLTLLFFLWSWSLKAKVARRTKELSSANTVLFFQMGTRIQAEQALRESERRYREIFNTPNDAIIIHDPEEGIILDINEPGLDMLGYARHELVGTYVGKLSSGEKGAITSEALTLIRMAAVKGPQVVEWHLCRNDGSVFWSEISFKAAQLMDRHCVVSVVRDITARKEAEESLSHEREQLSVTLQSIGDGVITSDVHGRVVLMNRVAETLTGWHCGAALGEPLAEVFRIDDTKTHIPFNTPANSAMVMGNIPDGVHHTLLKAKDGRECPIANRGAPIMDGSGVTVGAVLVFRDVTDELRMEEELLKARKLESVGVLAGGIAHDFNNILMAVLGGVSLARTCSLPNSEIHRLLTDVLKGCGRARDLTQQLLTFSKGGAPITRVASVVDVVQESAGFILRGSRVRCDTHFMEDLWPVEIDAGQISQVVQNLILNAIQAMPGGGRIEIVAENHTMKLPQAHTLQLQAGRYVTLSFHDDGPGIPSQFIDRIFDPFFTTKTSGSGLGLATTHSIVSKHKGMIQVRSSSEAGTCFTIYLPASEAVPPAPSEERAPVQTSRRGRILVMDDEALVRDVVAALLGSMGYEVLLSANGEEAVAIYKASHGEGAPVDMVITDLTVVGAMGGLEAAALIREWDPEARVVVSSGYSNDPVMADCTAHGFCAAIAKPYTHDDLMMVVAETLNA